MENNMVAKLSGRPVYCHLPIVPYCWHGIGQLICVGAKLNTWIDGHLTQIISPIPEPSRVLWGSDHYGKPFVAIFNINIYLFNKNICMQCLHFYVRYLNLFFCVQ
jgi:hypothetical protein